MTETQFTNRLINETSPYQTFDEQCAKRTSAALGLEAFDTAFTEGAGFGLDEAIRYALDENPQPQHQRPVSGER